MRERQDLFWAEFFGISAGELRTAGASIVPHVALADYRGVWFFRRGARLIVSAPEAWHGRIRSGLARARDPLALPDHDAAARMFGAGFDRFVGPTFHGSIEPTDFRPRSAGHVRALTDADAEVVAELRDACDSEDWSNSAMDKAQLFRAAAFEDGRIVAMAAFRAWDDVAGDPCVVTLAGHRGRGHAKAVLSHVLAAAIADDQVLLYQTLESNVAAVRIALELGYTRYAERVAVRLTTDAPLD